jgi:hypothetical protein
MPSELTKKTISKIIDPPKVDVHIGGQDIVLKPLPDAVFAKIGTAISDVIGTFLALKQSTEADGQTRRIEWKDIISLGPQLIEALVPSSSEIIAASLRKDVEWVNDNVYAITRVQLLKTILEVEGVPELLGELQGLAALLFPGKAPKVEQATPANTSQTSTEQAPIPPLPEPIRKVTRSTK